MSSPSKDNIGENKLQIHISDEKEQEKSRITGNIFLFGVLLFASMLLGAFISHHNLINAHENYESGLRDYIEYQDTVINKFEDNLYFLVEQDVAQVLPDGSRVYINFPEYFNHSWTNWNSDEITQIEIAFPDCLETNLCFIVYNNAQFVGDDE